MPHPALVLLLSWLAAAVPVAQLESWAARGEADEILAELGQLKPDLYPQAERARVAAALVKAARAARRDASVAALLAERALAFDRSADGLTVLGELELQQEQRAAAQRHLEAALSLAPEHVPALRARAELASAEREDGLAVELLEKAVRLGDKSAAGPLARARAADREHRDSLARLQGEEKQLSAKLERARLDATRVWLDEIAREETEQADHRRLAPDGVRRGEAEHFTFTYSAASHRTAQMLSFESRVEKVLEKAYDFVTDKLGHAPAGKTPVVLMTAAEYQQKYAGSHLSRAAGFWDGHQIVVNGGAEVAPLFIQIMVHEYTHAVVTSLSGQAAPRWLNEGLAENMRLCAMGQDGKIGPFERARLLEWHRGPGLPTLAQADSILAGLAPGSQEAYALVSIAARLLVEKRSYREVVETLRELARAPRPLQVVEKRLMEVSELEKAIAEEVAHR